MEKCLFKQVGVILSSLLYIYGNNECKSRENLFEYKFEID